ncbi:MAG: ABC transporter ATP-binding protein [Thermomicrobiales bacterium]
MMQPTTTAQPTAPFPTATGRGADAAPVVLRTAGLKKLFGRVTAVQDVSIAVQQGDVFGFLGPNGSGKTTTVAMILGLIEPTAGNVELFGQTSTEGRYNALHKVGSIIESPAFYPFLSGRDNLHVVARLRNVPKARVGEVLDQVYLGDRADRKYSAYSLGMKQRLAIGAALLNDPELLMLDEPTNGLDPEGMVEVRNLIIHLATQGKTIFLCSHLLAEVQQVCTRVSFINRGVIVKQGTTEDLLRTGNSHYLEVDDLPRAIDLLRSMPSVTEWRPEGRGVQFACEGDCAADVAAAVVGTGLRLNRLQPVETSLESIYLELVGADAQMQPGMTAGTAGRS